MGLAIGREALGPAYRGRSLDVRGFSEARPELVRAARVSVSRSARAAACGFASELRVAAGSSSATDASSSRPIEVDPVASAAPPHALQRERSGHHPSRGRLPQHTRRRLRHRTQAELRVWQTACDERVEPRTIPAGQADLNRPRFPRDDQHGVNRGDSWPVATRAAGYGVPHLGRALLGFGFASDGSKCLHVDSAAQQVWTFTRYSGRAPPALREALKKLQQDSGKRVQLRIRPFASVLENSRTCRPLTRMPI